VPRVIFEVPKTMDKLREDVGEWSLADDVGLMMVLEEVAASMKGKIRQVEREVDSLLHETSAVHVSLRNAFTSFSMLSQTQFVENRVYDNDDELIRPEASSANKSASAADTLADANRRHELLVRRRCSAGGCARTLGRAPHSASRCCLRCAASAARQRRCRQCPDGAPNLRCPSTLRRWRRRTRRCVGEYTQSTTPPLQAPGKGPMATTGTTERRCRS